MTMAHDTYNNADMSADLIEAAEADASDEVRVWNRCVSHSLGLLLDGKHSRAVDELENICCSVEGSPFKGMAPIETFNGRLEWLCERMDDMRGGR